MYAIRSYYGTDVDGVYSCDPRLVPDAVLPKRMSYKEAMELSYFGAKVLHPRTIAPIAQFHIPCLIKNSLNPQGEGTLIGPEMGGEADLPVKGISDLSGISMINISGPGMKGMVGMAGRMFSAVSRAGVSVVLITQSSSEYSISFCIHTYDADKARHALESEFELELNVITSYSIHYTKLYDRQTALQCQQSDPAGTGATVGLVSPVSFRLPQRADHHRHGNDLPDLPDPRLDRSIQQ